MSDRLRVLLVEDNELDQIAFTRRVAELDAPYSYTIAGTLHEARKKLAQEAFDAVLIDQSLPDGYGVQLLDNLGDAAGIVVTGIGNEETAAAALKAGASDYLVKHTDRQHMILLPSVIENAVRNKKIEIELRRHRENLEILVAERTSELRNEIRRREILENELKALVDVKHTLLQEVHHRVKNNLQIVSSLLSLQKADVGDAVSVEYFEASMRQINAIAMVHELFYSTNRYAEVSLHAYLRMVSSELMDLNTGYDVQVQFDLEEVSLPMDIIVPISLIASELISNAVKYAFPAAQREICRPELRFIGNFETDESYRLVISDNGAGDLGRKEKPHSTSLGHTIVEALIDQLEGRISCEKKPGYSWIMTFPVPGNQSRGDRARESLTADQLR